MLTQDEEALLVDWLIELCRRGIPINKQYLLNSIQQIIQEDGRLNSFKAGRPGDGWFAAFLKRHPDISQRNAESICRMRGALTEQCIRGWFTDVKKYFDDNNIAYVLQDPRRQYNTDETGFQLDPKSGNVLAPGGENVYTEAEGRKEQVTVLVTTCADGRVMQPAIVYPCKRAIPNYIVDKLPDDRFCIVRSDSGWMMSDIFF